MINKLRRKRLLGPKGLTDIAASRIIARDYAEMKRIRDLILGGSVGPILEHEDFYRKPQAGYRAHHFIVMKHGVPVEVQLQTYRMNQIGDAGHSLYKSGTQDAKAMAELTSLATEADKGRQWAIKKFTKIAGSPSKIKKKLTAKSNPRRRYR